MSEESYSLAWREYPGRGDCKIRLWKDGNDWQWYFSNSHIRDYESGVSGKVLLPTMKKMLRERFYPPQGIRFRQAPRPAAAGESEKE